VKFYREPDAHLGIYDIGLTQGQLLCIPMILAGIALIVYAVKSGKIGPMPIEHKKQKVKSKKAKQG